MFAFYTRALANYPVLTQALSTGTLFGTGDLIAQFFVERRQLFAPATSTHTTISPTPTNTTTSHSLSSSSYWDPFRTARMAFFGTVWAGPILHHWYRFLDRRIQLSTPVRSLVGRVLVDQAFFAPCFIASFFLGQGLLAGDSKETIRERIRKSYPEALRTNYLVWPAVQGLNFWWVPLQHRLMVVNTFALGWNTYLSHVNQESSEEGLEEKAVRL